MLHVDARYGGNNEKDNEVKPAKKSVIKNLSIFICSETNHHMIRKKVDSSGIKKKRKIQVKISDPFHDKKPSEVKEVYWLYASNRIVPYPKPTDRNGKWLLFVPNNEMDEAWQKVKDATEKGLLGGASKVATAKPNPNAASSESKVICVYSYDWKDEKDVMRIREELRKLGFIQKIPYKTDQATYEGKYRVRGHKRISQYYC